MGLKKYHLNAAVDIAARESKWNGVTHSDKGHVYSFFIFLF